MDEYLQDEIVYTLHHFDLTKAIEFQVKHDVQIIRSEDYMYGCWIDKKCYSVAITPLYSLVNGINNYLNLKENDNINSQSN